MRVADYQVVEELLRNDRQSLCRAANAGHGSVLLKLPLRRPPTVTDLASLKREYEILKELSLPGVPAALSFSQNGEGCWLVLEDPGGVALQSAAESFRRDLAAFLKLAIDLCSILGNVHGAGVIHRNVSTQSILVDPKTSRAGLVDFSAASRLRGYTDHGRSSNLPPAALPYFSPEQTGRINREVDHRSDFYSLGITFYELLVGAPPFQSADHLELIHWHIAKDPTPPHQINPGIPEPLSRIVLKLLAKTPEERYQSAAGIRADLEICARQWAERKVILSFPLGRRDVADQFRIPQRLYGRESEVQRLAAIFEEACQGNAGLALVAGYSGIGKTSLIEEIYRPIVGHKGYFLSGKFDQIVRNIPYGALLQAFRGFVRQLLAEDEDRLARWRLEMHEALGTNGGVLAEVIPELELILGPQPPAPPLAPAETQNRFQLAFQNFLGVLARAEHPLVIFLDDLQWADSATLALLEPLLIGREIRYLLVVGAYRDNEVDAGHQLLRTIARLEAADAKIHRLALGPLSLAGLTSLISDTLHQQPAEVQALALLIQEKTAGNPFFVIQFLKTLHEEGLLKLDYAQGRWGFEIEAIAGAAITDNVVDLMIRKLQRLASRTQQVLSLAACIGNEFSLSTLNLIAEQRQEPEVEADLAEALREGFILPLEGGREVMAGEGSPTTHSHRFLHDRVQQAAYALIPQEEKQRVRLRVGRLLRERWDAASEEGIFDVIEHLNFGAPLITDPEERGTLAQLNLTAARKAKSSTAYEAALGYLKAGLFLLGGESWDASYGLTFGLEIEAAECEYLCGQFDAAEERFSLLLARARTADDKAEVHHLRLVQYENRSRYTDAVQCGREGLALLGVFFPDGPAETQAALELEMVSIEALLGGRPVETLVDLPVMEDAEKRVVMRLLTSIWAPSYITGNQILARLISATMVRFSLKHGCTGESAYGYVTHAITVGPVRGDYRSAYEWGTLALRTDERFGNPKQRAKIHQQFHAHVSLWRRPLVESIPHAREACRSGLETGDFNYAAYGAFTESWAAFLISRELGHFVQEQSSNEALLRKMKMTDPLGALMVIVNWAQALRGHTAGNLSLSTEDFDEEKYLQTYGTRPFFMAPYYAMKLSLCLTFEAYEGALETARHAREAVGALSGTIWPVYVDFLYGMTVAALYRDAGEGQRRLWISELSAIQKSLAVLAENCPENFSCFSLLLRAEQARISGRDLEAAAEYTEAIRFARATGNVSAEALASELCARFWRGRGNEDVWGFYLRQAAQLYARWGARAKVRSLEQQWPALTGVAASLAWAEPDPGLDPAHTALDMATVTKAARAISQEIDIERLLERLVKIAIENAGAQRGLLLSEKEGKLAVVAEGWVEREDVQVSELTPLEARADLSRAIVQYVHKTQESVVLGNAAHDDRFRGDPYVASSSHLSILCVPIVHQGKSQGILYLENKLAGEAFTAERARLMHLLASQAAISLENARLYQEVRHEAASRQHAEETLRSVVEGTASVTGADFFRSLVQHLASALEVRYAFLTQCSADKTIARMLAFWKGGEFVEDVVYDPNIAPCRNVLKGQVALYQRNVQELFPEDTDLVALGAESYLGLPMINVSGQVIGHLAVLDDKPMRESPQQVRVLQIFAARAAAELDRLKAENDLRAALTEVEQLKNRLQAENIYLQEEIRREHNFEEIVGNSPALIELLSQVEQAAPTDSTVLIYGETGAGKELIARAIHNRSKRRDSPLVKVNCGAISAGLVESELFGHVKGAFTGALERRTGRFELANGGTIFLDEVGELLPETQVKLLRVLQEQEFEPVGSSRTIRVDVRVIAATNRDLQKEVAAGRFRADLFYRLNVLPMTLPPLRSRREDIPKLVTFFLSRFSRKLGKPIASVTQESMHRLMAYSWPGNVRELQNIIERAFVLSAGPVLSLGRDLLPDSELQGQAEASIFPPPSTSAAPGFPREAAAAPSPGSPRPGALDDIQKQHILSVLGQTAWVIEGPSGAAKVLSLHPNTLRSRMKKLGIQRPSHEIS